MRIQGMHRKAPLLPRAGSRQSGPTIPSMGGKHVPNGVKVPRLRASETRPRRADRKNEVDDVEVPSKRYLFRIDSYRSGMLLAVPLLVLQKLVTPIVDWLHHHGVKPNHITGTSIGLCCLYGGLTLLYAEAIWPLTFLWAVMGGRILLDIMDGKLARRHDLQSRSGKVFNEAEYFISDLALYLPLAFTPPFPRELMLWIVGLSAVTELAGVLGYAISGRRRDDPPMSKDIRMAAIGLTAFLVGVTGTLGSIPKTLLWGTAVLLPVTALWRVFQAFRKKTFLRGIADRDQNHRNLDQLALQRAKTLAENGAPLRLLFAGVENGARAMEVVYDLMTEKGITFTDATGYLLHVHQLAARAEARVIRGGSDRATPKAPILCVTLRDDEGKHLRHGQRWRFEFGLTAEQLRIEQGEGLHRLQRDGEPPYNLIAMEKEFEYFDDNRDLESDAQRLYAAVAPGGSLILSVMDNPTRRFYRGYFRGRAEMDDDQEVESPRWRKDHIETAFKKAGFVQFEIRETRHRTFATVVFRKPNSLVAAS